MDTPVGRTAGQIIPLGERQGRVTWYSRFAVRTSLISEGDDIASVVAKCVDGFVQAGDVVFISEKAVATSQGRAIPVNKIRPRWLARVLSGFVHKVPYGIGLGIPETMEMAIREAGIARILVAALAGFVGRLVGRQGDFYRVAGRRVASIDGPTPYTIPPLNHCVVLGPLEPDRVARRVGSITGTHVAIVDINDIGGAILGSTAGADRRSILAALADNPLGQGSARTPVGVLRPISGPASDNGHVTLKEPDIPPGEHEVTEYSQRSQGNGRAQDHDPVKITVTRQVVHCLTPPLTTIIQH